MKLFATLLLGGALALAGGEVFAADWTTSQGQAKVGFTATTNGTAVQGSFPQVTAKITFDPAHPELGKIHGEIGTGQIDADYSDVSVQLKMPEWLDADKFKLAVFDSTSIKRLQANQFQMDGTLNLRGVTQTISMAFTWNEADENGAKTAHMKGYTVLKRTAFGIGQGKWQNTDVVADDVQVSVDLKATLSGPADSAATPAPVAAAPVAAPVSVVEEAKKVEVTPAPVAVAEKEEATPPVTPVTPEPEKKKEALPSLAPIAALDKAAPTPAKPEESPVAEAPKADVKVETPPANTEPAKAEEVVVPPPAPAPKAEGHFLRLPPNMAAQPAPAPKEEAAPGIKVGAEKTSETAAAEDKKPEAPVAMLEKEVKAEPPATPEPEKKAEEPVAPAPEPVKEAEVLPPVTEKKEETAPAPEQKMLETPPANPERESFNGSSELKEEPRGLEVPKDIDLVAPPSSNSSERATMAAPPPWEEQEFSAPPPALSKPKPEVAEAAPVAEKPVEEAAPLPAPAPPVAEAAQPEPAPVVPVEKKDVAVTPPPPAPTPAMEAAMPPLANIKVENAPAAPVAAPVPPVAPAAPAVMPFGTGPSVPAQGVAPATTQQTVMAPPPPPPAATPAMAAAMPPQANIQVEGAVPPPVAAPVPSAPQVSAASPEAIVASATPPVARLLATEPKMPAPFMQVGVTGQVMQGRPVKLTVHLRHPDGRPMGPDDLKEVHTQKLHLLLVDPTMTDYQHLHPEPTKQVGSYEATFTPRTPYSYVVWADITPVDSQQAYVRANVKGEQAAPPVKQVESQHAEDQGLQFDLSFDGPLVAGSETMGTLKVSENGRPFTDLEPVMGAFAHIVAFSDGGREVVHVHPMGKEPVTDHDRGGPVLEFHLQPLPAGFVKLFAQVKVNGEDRFIPFGVMTQP